MNHPEMQNPRKIAIQAHNLSKTFEGFEALKSVSFSVAKGEIFGLLGPNGAGKTTCMKIFGGILLPTQDGGGSFINIHI